MGDMIPDGYRILVHFDTNQERFIATVPELGDIKEKGETRAEALTKAEEAIEAAILKAAEAEEGLPTPLDRTDFSGEMTITISPSLHRELAFLAVEDGMETEQLAAELITTGVTIKSTGRLRSGGGSKRGKQDNRGRRRGNRGNKKDYHNIMDDRASFIEYVRSIDERGGKRGGGGGGGGGGRGRGRRRK